MNTIPLKFILMWKYTQELLLANHSLVTISSLSYINGTSPTLSAAGNTHFRNSDLLKKHDINISSKPYALFQKYGQSINKLNISDVAFLSEMITVKILIVFHCGT